MKIILNYPYGANIISCVQFFEATFTVCHQVPLPMGFSKREYQGGLPFPNAGDLPHPGNLPDPGIKPESLASPVLAGEVFTTSATWEAQCKHKKEERK